VVATPSPGDLPDLVDALATWQHDGAPVPLHPGDVGWLWRFGADATAGALRTWSRDGRLLAVGMLDGPDLLRLACAPDAWTDRDLADEIRADLDDPATGVLSGAAAQVEARWTGALTDALRGDGWVDGEPWTPLRRDLAGDPPEVDPDLRIVLLDHEHHPDSVVAARCAVQRTAFPRSTFTPERWHAMAGGAPYARARCVVGYAGQEAVAAVTVWSAGPGRPGLLEPLGVDPAHRGRGYGRAIGLGAAAVLAGLGASSATVCTPRSNAGAVATYEAAGFVALPDVTDLTRPG